MSQALEQVCELMDEADSIVEEMAIDLINNKEKYLKYEETMISARIDEFSWIFKRIYPKATKWFESNQFRILGDLEYPQFGEDQPKLRSFERIFLHQTQPTMARFFHLPSTGASKLFYFMRMNTLTNQNHFVAFESYFSDNTLIATSNTEGRGIDNNEPSNLHILALDPETPIDRILAIHEKRIAEHENSSQGIHAVRVKNFETYNKVQEIIRKQKAEYLRSTGYFSRKELSFYLPEEDDVLIELLHKKIQEIARERHPKTKTD